MGPSPQRCGCVKRMNASMRQRMHNTLPARIAAWALSLSFAFFHPLLANRAVQAQGIVPLASPDAVLSRPEAAAAAGQGAQKAADGKGDRLDSAAAGKGDLLISERAFDMNALPPVDPALAQAGDDLLYLEVFINGQPTHLVGEFKRNADGTFSARVKELRELGLVPPKGAKDEDWVALSDMEAEAEYDESAQQLGITVPEGRRLAKVYDLHGGNAARTFSVSKPGTGLVVNYSLFASARAEHAFAATTFEGFSANLDGWIYSPYGTLSAAGILRVDEFRKAQVIRLNTTWRYTDLERAMTYAAGDVITAGPAWARPIRLGGVRISRNFKVRPDIITTPLPSLSGTAAVPTTVDVYLNNIKVHSQEVAPGPFTIANIPAISGSGEAQLVMHDATGKTVVARRRFYVSPSLLRKGLLEFSAAAGVARRNYGAKSFDYGKDPVGSASIRYGLFDALTVHGHTELAQDVQLVGGGLTGVLFDRLLLGAAVAYSHNSIGDGLLFHAQAETRIASFSFNASSQRTFGDYLDLASITAPAPETGAPKGAVTTGARMPKALDTVSLGYGFDETGASISAGYIHNQDAAGEHTHSLSLNYSQKLFGAAQLYATAVIDLKKPKRPSVFVGVTIPLGGNKGTVSTGGSYDEAGRWRVSASYDKALKQEDYSVGWRARATYGDLKSAQASLAWRTPKATFRATAMQMEDNTYGHASVDGALVVADRSIFASNRIDDSFAIVNAGAPGVTVRYENRVIGKTGRDGRLLIPTVRTFERNKISIDPETLPVDAQIPRDKAYVVPPQKSGVVVDFGIKMQASAALVSFVNDKGEPIAVGSEVYPEDAGDGAEPAIVGYDGQAFLENLKAHNRVRIVSDAGTCIAEFDFTPKPGEQVFIGPVPCRPEG